jgi:hypothetical protein
MHGLLHFNKIPVLIEMFFSCYSRIKAITTTQVGRH